MATALTITPGRRLDGSAVLTLIGEIDMSNIDVLATALDSTNGPVLLDLAAVDYLDSAAVTVLFGHAERIEITANPLLIPALTYCGLADLAPIRPADSETPDSPV